MSPTKSGDVSRGMRLRLCNCTPLYIQVVWFHDLFLSYILFYIFCFSTNIKSVTDLIRVEKPGMD